MNIIENKIRTYGASCVAIEPGWGSGFFVRPDLIMTAGHVLRGRPEELEIHLRSRKVIRGKIKCIDLENDVGVVQVNPNDHEQPSLSIDNPLIGYLLPRDVVVVRIVPEHGENGFMLSYEAGTAYHDVSPRHIDSGAVLKNPMCMWIAAPKGSSGSPVIYNGKVAGMINAGSDYGYKYSVNTSYMLKALSNFATNTKN